MMKIEMPFVKFYSILCQYSKLDNNLCHYLEVKYSWTEILIPSINKVVWLFFAAVISIALSDTDLTLNWEHSGQGQASIIFANLLF